MDSAVGEVPEYFYKYRPMNSPEMIRRVEQIVLGCEIYFSPPSSFNDPFDLKPAFSFDASPERQREDYLRLSRKFQPHYSESQHSEEADSVMAKTLNAENRPAAEANVQALHSFALTSVGVFCVSTKRDDILMWSHYADSHRGVCLEFNGMSPLMAHAQQVNYSRKRVAINPYVDDSMQMMEKAMLTKSEHWTYEGEWRLLNYTKGSGAVKFRPLNLTGIIVGALASRDTSNTVREWAAQRASPLKIYRATISNKEFEVLITPHHRA